MKLPLISYVVQTQKVKNSAGFERIYERVFIDEDLFSARQKAVEYYNAAVDLLSREGEISESEIGKVCYKNPGQYNGGISIFIRFNQPFFYKSVGYVENEKLRMATYQNISRKEAGKERQAREIEMYLLEQRITATTDEILRPMQPKNPAEFIRILQDLPLKKVEFLPWRKMKNRTLEVEHLLETVCAFLNSGGGKIIVGQTAEMDFKSFPGIHETEEILRNLLKETFQENARQIWFRRWKGSVPFIEITVGKSATEAFYKGEYFYRNSLGNVLDLDFQLKF